MGHLGHVAHRVDDDVALGKLFVAVAAVDDLRVVGDKAQRVMQVLGLGDELLVMQTAQVELVCDALQKEAVGNMGAHMPQADDADLSLSCHDADPLS